MEYQNVIYWLGSAINETPKFGTKAWVEKNENAKPDGYDAAD